jgi:hypothetical protein
MLPLCIEQLHACFVPSRMTATGRSSTSAACSTATAWCVCTVQDLLLPGACECLTFLDRAPCRLPTPTTATSSRCGRWGNTRQSWLRWDDEMNYESVSEQELRIRPNVAPQSAVSPERFWWGTMARTRAASTHRAHLGWAAPESGAEPGRPSRAGTGRRFKVVSNGHTAAGDGTQTRKLHSRSHWILFAAVVALGAVSISALSSVVRLPSSAALSAPVCALRTRLPTKLGAWVPQLERGLQRVCTALATAHQKVRAAGAFKPLCNPRCAC